MAYRTRGLSLIVGVSLMSGICFAAEPVPPKPPTPAAPAAPTVPAATAVPTTADARRLFTDAKYSEVIKAVTKITTSREWQAEKTDAYDLYIMKGEAHLHLKENALASSSFDTAAKIAGDKAAADQALIDKGTKEKPVEQAVTDKYTADRAAEGVARSTSYLIKHSTGAFFVPKATANQRVVGGNPNEHVKIDILSPDTRKTALTALWTDEKNAANPTITEASNTDSKSIQAVMGASKVIPALRDFDLAANGSDDDTSKMAAAVADHGRDLLQEMLDKMAIRLDVITGEAMTVESSRAGLPGGGYVDRWHKHGLEGNQMAELKSMVKNTGDISAAIKLLIDGLSPEKGFFDKTAKDTKKIHESADTLVKMDYTQTYVNKETAMKKGA